MNKWKSEDDKDEWNTKKPPKEGDGRWHIKLTLYDPDGEKFERIYKTKPTDGKLKEKFDPKDVLNEGVTHLGVTSGGKASSLATRLNNKEKRFLGGNPSLV